MNSVSLMGRLTADPVVRYTTGATQMAVAKYSLAVDRRKSSNGERETDFINIVAFGKAGEFAEKYFRKGMRVAVHGRIQTGSYVNRTAVKRFIPLTSLLMTRNSQTVSQTEVAHQIMRLQRMTMDMLDRMAL